MAAHVVVVAFMAVLLTATGVLANNNHHGDSAHLSPLIHHHSLQTPFVADWWQEGVPHWDIGGDAVVVSDRFVRLTPPDTSRSGYAWNTIPNEYEDWEVRLTFIIRRNPRVGADGIAFWYTAETHREELDFFYGQKMDFKGIGVVFDTYDNDAYRDQPSVLILKNLNREKHSWNMAEDMRNELSMLCKFNHRPNVGNEPNEMILRYYKKQLSLRVKSVNRDLDVDCGTLSDIELPTGYFFGITASTGGMYDTHDILNFQMRAIGESYDNPLAPVEHFDEETDKQDRSYWGKQERKSNRER